ncbi:hypothetical protein HBN50_09485 [Halobacteriovorax sp. GB3]|uniref:hypothetical protein n=1 Tax=Halobacteriovorax sp. GB3 TaxID=2719615 RepID=UPI0023605E15|nr:hypothetical protein [Halobacteriovorax sp. GB3]MDD0853329.1 hypothetical protein [Halobacteriovorax sp. GB3]
MRPLYLLCLLLVSCSSMTFDLSEAQSFNQSGNDRVTKVSRSRGRIETYLWGMTPAKQVVSVKNELRKTGLERGRSVNLTLSHSALDKALLYLSFGLIMPAQYEVKAYGVNDQRSELSF